MNYLAVMAALLVGAQVENQRVYLDVTGLMDGDYHLTIVDGAVTVHPIVVLKLGQIPKPPVPPTPDDLKALKQTTLTALASVVDTKKAQTQASLSAVYRMVSALPLDSKANYKRGIDALFTATLTQLGRESEWAAFKTATDAALDKLPDARYSAGLSAVGDVLGGQ